MQEGPGGAAELLDVWGQSEGIEEKEAFAVEGAVVVCAALGLLSLDAGAERAMAIQEETEVQERHL